MGHRVLEKHRKTFLESYTTWERKMDIKNKITGTKPIGSTKRRIKDISPKTNCD